MIRKPDGTTDMNGPTTIGELFDASILTVPSFQRAYAWGGAQLENFFDDLYNHPDSDPQKKYFSGTILLSGSPAPGSSGFFSFAIVDGQQRLTTACLFASAAVRVLEGLGLAGEGLHAEYSARFLCSDQIRKLRTIAEDDGFLEQLILSEGAPECRTPSQRRLLKARDYFLERLASYSAPQLFTLLKKLSNALVLVYAVNSDSEATQIFELQNDRGKKLTNLEALKSYLMHGIYVHAGANTEADLNIVQAAFADIYRRIESMEPHYDAPGEDQLLSYHCLAYENWSESGGGTEDWRKPKELTKRLLGKVPAQNRTQWIKAFSHRLQASYSHALAILESRNSTEGIPLGDLTALGRTAPFWPLLLKCWKHDRSDRKSQFSESVRYMESFACRAVVAGKRSDAGESELRYLALNFNGNFDALNTALKGMRERWGIPGIFRDKLNSASFYHFGRVATYILWRYENYLRGQTGRQSSRLLWETFTSPSSEAVRYCKDHIEPKDANNPALVRMVKWDETDTEAARPFSEVFLHRLGNLVLDTTSTGAAKGAGNFASRIDKYAGETTFLSQGELIHRFASSGEEGQKVWDEAAIRRRQAVLIEFATTYL